MATLPGDIGFEPKVWADHVAAYFDRKLLMGQLAVKNDSLVAAPGTTINFPFYKAIGDAEEPAADAALTVDKIQDDAFSATVKEIGKAVGVREAALMKSADAREGLFSEVQQQIARVMAEKVDKDLVTEVNTVGNYIQAYTSAATSDLMTIRRLLQGKVTAFGDKHDQAVAVIMHSQHYLDLMTDSTAGFLQADANDPFWGMPGFMGRLLGMALFVFDGLPEGTAVGGKKVFEAFVMKSNPYGIMTKKAPDMASDYDILHREYVFAGTEWYAVKAFHAKVAALDLRIGRLSVVTQLTA